MSDTQEIKWSMLQDPKHWGDFFLIDIPKVFELVDRDFRPIAWIGPMVSRREGTA